MREHLLKTPGAPSEMHCPWCHDISGSWCAPPPWGDHTEAASLHTESRTALSVSFAGNWWAQGAPDFLALCTAGPLMDVGEDMNVFLNVAARALPRNLPFHSSVYAFSPLVLPQYLFIYSVSSHTLNNSSWAFSFCLFHLWFFLSCAVGMLNFPTFNP